MNYKSTIISSAIILCLCVSHITDLNIDYSKKIDSLGNIYPASFYSIEVPLFHMIKNPTGGAPLFVADNVTDDRANGY
jgi:hypothetical protein